jgi:hypothetical protein
MEGAKESALDIGLENVFEAISRCQGLNPIPGSVGKRVSEWVIQKPAIYVLKKGLKKR